MKRLRRSNVSDNRSRCSRDVDCSRSHRSSSQRIKVLGISCITNLAAGMQANLSHEEVVETTQRVKQSFKALVKETLTLL